MTDLERLKAWLATYPEAEKFSQMQVGYTSSLPGDFGVFPAGIVEVERRENLFGQATVTNQYNFALYLVLEQASGGDAAALCGADWVMDFQRWVQQQSAAHQAPVFGNIDQNRETISAQSGALYEADAGGQALYMIQLAARFRMHYEL